MHKTAKVNSSIYILMQVAKASAVSTGPACGRHVAVHAWETTANAAPAAPPSPPVIALKAPTNTICHLCRITSRILGKFDFDFGNFVAYWHIYLL